MIKAKIILDSQCTTGARLTTFEVEFHRFILAELNTHRISSKNSASSRAIPVKKVMERVSINPAMPIHIGKNQKGMQAREEVSGGVRDEALKIWLEARDNALESAKKMEGLGVHKQVVNRLLEPFMMHTVIVSATNFTNFFHQRLDPNAQPEMKELARLMAELYYTNSPDIVEPGYWHLPYIQKDEQSLSIGWKKEISTARCARVSFLNHNGIRSLDDDLELFGRLKIETHFSPFEHVAQASEDGEERSGNFVGFRQFRKEFPNEFAEEFDYFERLKVITQGE